METELVIQRGSNSAATLRTPEDPSRVRGHPLPPGPVPRASFHRPVPPALLPPPCQGAALGSSEIRAGTAGRSIHRGPATTPPPRPTRGLCCGRIRTRLTWGPQPPQLTGMSPARNDQPREPPSRRAAPPTPAPSPPPPPRPRPAHPRLPPPPQFQRATPPSPHASHSLSREGAAPLARRTR